MSRYDWSNTPNWVNYKAIDPTGQVWNYEIKPTVFGSECWHVCDGRAKKDTHVCPDWQDSLEERPKWEPKHGDKVYIVTPSRKNGYSETWYSTTNDDDFNTFKRGFIFRTEAEAIAKVKELGW